MSKPTLAEPLVSAIIPVFNAGASLSTAISSALEQTYPHIEVVVVDDGSTKEATKEIIGEFAERITYIRQENSGVAAARQTGVEASGGELIALLDQDDVWLPGKIRHEVGAWAAHPEVGLIHSSYYLITDEGKRTGAVRLPEREYEPLPDLLLSVPVSSCTSLFPKEAFRAAGPFDPALSGSDDWDMWLRIAASGYKFYCISEPLSEYRVHKQNQSRDLDRMSRTALGVLDKFYALESVPEAAQHYKNRAYAARHTWAASVYYGAKRLDRAEAHTLEAARLSPESVVNARFMQSLVYAGAGGPGKQNAEAAVRFGMDVLRKSELSRSEMRQLEARAQLVLASHARASSKMEFIEHISRAVLTDPAVVSDGRLWGAARRLPAQAWSRLRTRSASLEDNTSQPAKSEAE